MKKVVLSKVKKLMTYVRKNRRLLAQAQIRVQGYIRRQSLQERQSTVDLHRKGCWHRLQRKHHLKVFQTNVSWGVLCVMHLLHKKELLTNSRRSWWKWSRRSPARWTWRPGRTCGSESTRCSWCSWWAWRSWKFTQKKNSLYFWIWMRRQDKGWINN